MSGMLRVAIAVSLVLAAAARGEEPPTSTSTPTPAPAAPESGLAVPPQLEKLVPADLPPDTAFPAPEVAVVLGIDVSATGAVEDVRVAQGAGEPFDSAAVAAARKFEFE